MPDGHTVRHLTADDLELMDALLQTFGEVFNELEPYTGKRPGSDYLRRLLGSDCFIAMVAVKAGTVVGGLTAYELKKFEQERRASPGSVPGFRVHPHGKPLKVAVAFCSWKWFESP